MDANASTRTTPDARTRVDLPLVMLPADVAAALGLKSASAARRAILRGECGPYSRRGRRLLLRREAFLEALRARETTPPMRGGEGPPPVPPRWAPALSRAVGMRGSGQ